MQTCNNCAAAFNDNEEGLVVTHKHTTATAICDSCLTNARLVKLVVRRGDIGGFNYEQFSVIETQKPFPSEHAGKGLSTPIGQAKR
jgi:hypothetical protein